MIQSVLMPGSTPFEKAIDAAVFRLDGVADALRTIHDPEKAPEAFVPFLAWGFSTDLWDRNWPIEKKRAVAKAWYRLHRKKGTLTGIKEAVRFFEGEVVAARTPPDGTIPDPTLTKEEREKYLTRFRQIRFYRYRSGGSASFAAYLSSGYRLPALFVGARAFPGASDAVARVGRRAFVFDPLTGAEEPVKRVERITTTSERAAVTFEEVVLPGKIGRAAFAGRKPAGKTFTMDMGARGRRFSISIDGTYSETISDLHVSGILPSDQPIEVRPRRAALPGPRVAGQLFPSLGGVATEFVNRKSDGEHRTFLPASSARLRVFEQVFLFDPSRLPDRRNARTFVGATRLGMPAYHARLTIQKRGRISPFAIHGFVHGYPVATDKSAMRRTIEAVRLSKSLRDKILVTNKTMRPATAGDGYRVGTINVGTWVRDL